MNFDFNPYKEENLYYVRGCDGFISRDGIFYVNGKRNIYNSSHDYYAEELVDYLYNENIYDVYYRFKMRNKNYAKLVLGAKDILIHFYGFVNYQKLYNNLDITGPDKKYNSYSVTDKQILLLEKLLILNNDSYEEIYQLFNNEYDNYDLHKTRMLEKPNEHK